MFKLSNSFCSSSTLSSLIIGTSLNIPGLKCSSLNKFPYSSKTVLWFPLNEIVLLFERAFPPVGSVNIPDFPITGKVS